MKKIVWIKVSYNKYYKFVEKVNYLNIKILDSKIVDDKCCFKIYYDDYKKIKKYLISYNIEIDRFIGIEKIKILTKKYIFFIITSIISIVILLLLNNMIFKIEIISENKDTEKLIERELDKNNLKIFSLKHNHKYIENIVNKILEDNKNKLEWMEIKYDGLVMIVNVKEKDHFLKENNYKYCNIVADTDARIVSIKVDDGVIIKDINDYVNKGDIIIGGDIILNEEVKNKICAKGTIYGEVWYKVKVSVPLVSKKIIYTDKVRYNLGVNYNKTYHEIFKSRIGKKKNEYINIYSLNDFKIDLIKEKEYEEKEVKMSEIEAYSKAINSAIEKINLMLDEKEYIIYKKVLKKDANDSTIYVEVFIITKEEIGKLEVLEE